MCDWRLCGCFSILACRKLRWLDEVTSEERYQRLKKSWHNHNSSWFMCNAKGYDGYGCNQFTGCIPECRYYPEEGRIGDEEVLRWYEKEKGTRRRRKN